MCVCGGGGVCDLMIDTCKIVRNILISRIDIRIDKRTSVSTYAQITLGKIKSYSTHLVHYIYMHCLTIH